VYVPERIITFLLRAQALIDKQLKLAVKFVKEKVKNFLCRPRSLNTRYLSSERDIVVLSCLYLPRSFATSLA
jgi:hypothetical protein